MHGEGGAASAAWVCLSPKLRGVELIVETVLVWLAEGLVSETSTLGHVLSACGRQFLLHATWGDVVQTPPGSSRSL